MSLFTVKAITILDADGKRVVAKYFDQDKWSSEAKKKAFESLLKSKAQLGGQVMLLEDCVVLYREMGDVIVFVIGHKDENELLLETVVTALCESMLSVLRNEVHKLTILENLDSVMLIIDEAVDGGIILQGDASQIVEKVSVKGTESQEGPEKKIIKAIGDLLMS